MILDFDCDDIEFSGSRFIVIKKISSFGLTITKFNNEIGYPERAVVWVQTGNINYNKDFTYKEAQDFLEVITDKIKRCLK